MPPFAIAGLVAFGVVGGLALGYFVYSAFAEKETESCHKQTRSSKSDRSKPNISEKVYACRKCKGVVSEDEVIWSKKTGYHCIACFKHLHRLNKHSNGATCLACGDTPTVKYRDCLKDHQELCSRCLHGHFKNRSCPEEECRDLKKRR